MPCVCVHVCACVCMCTSFRDHTREWQMSGCSQKLGRPQVLSHMHWSGESNSRFCGTYTAHSSDRQTLRTQIAMSTCPAAHARTRFDADVHSVCAPDVDVHSTCASEFDADVNSMCVCVCVPPLPTTVRVFTSCTQDPCAAAP